MSARAAQERMKAAGYDVGPADGVIGGRFLAGLDRLLADAGRNIPAPAHPQLPFFAKLIQYLKKDEGFRANAYPDPLSGGDPWTIGYGATGPGIKQGVIWTEAQAAEALTRMALEHGNELEAKAPWIANLDPVRRGVLWNMAYNLGVEGLLAFKNTLAMVKAGDHAGAARGMLASLWAKQVKGRAQRLAKEMETGQWQ